MKLWRHSLYILLFSLFIISCDDDSSSNNTNNTNNINNTNNTNNQNVCLGTHECAFNGLKFCDGPTNNLKECITNQTTFCREWTESDCTLNGQTCQIIDESAQCACDSSCSIGDERCYNDNAENCFENQYGCFNWQTKTECIEGTNYCSVSGDTASCVTCEENCLIDDKRCHTNGHAIEICTTLTNGCPGFIPSSADPDCTETGKVCVDATCVCDNQCTLTDFECIGYTGTKICAENIGGCLTIGNSTCPTGEYCDVSGTESGSEQCITCETQAGFKNCTINKTQCEVVSGMDIPFEIQNCTLDATFGCTYWDFVEDCDDSTQICFDGDPNIPAACTSDCPAICSATEIVCVGNQLRSCNTSGYCNVWDATECDAVSNGVCNDSISAQCCVNECTAVGETMCNDATGLENQLLVCQNSITTGCREWVVQDTCVGPESCNDSGGDAVCCQNMCAVVDATQCNHTDNRAELCELQVTGCFDWTIVEQCDASQFCVDSLNECFRDGDTCETALEITLPFSIEGDNISEDYKNTKTYLDSSCEDGIYHGGGSEIVAAVYLTQDSTLIIKETTGLDAFLSVVTDCSTTICLVAEDSAPERIEFVAPADGTYYFNLEAYSSSTTSGYKFEIFMLEATEISCDDGVDNDEDGDYDCGDPDCFGIGACTVESLCGDGMDNDLDDATDCMDPDCTGIDPCGDEDTLERCTDNMDNDNDGNTDCDDPDCANIYECTLQDGIWQEFNSSSQVNLEGYVITFTPSGTDYNYAVDPYTGFFIEPGTGDATSYEIPSSSTDNYSTEENLPFAFNFWGVDYDVITVGVEGILSFDGFDSYSTSTTNFFDHPIIAYIWNDMQATTEGTDYVVDSGNHNGKDYWALTYYGREYGSTRIFIGQVVLFSDGTIQMYYDICEIETAYVGISKAGASGSVPPQTKFVISEGEVIITEIMYDSSAVLDNKGQYIEFYNTTSNEISMNNCILDDGLGNSLDLAGVTIPGGAHVVFVRDTNDANNGGITDGFDLGSDIILNSSGTLSISCTAGLIDDVVYTGDATPGHSYQVLPEAYDHLLNDTDASWISSFHNAQYIYGDGDYGTPGTINHDGVLKFYALAPEGFTTFPPAGWVVEDGGTTSDTWIQATDGALNNSDGTYAVVDSDDAGSGVDCEEGLVTPSLDLSTGTNYKIIFTHYYNWIGSDFGKVQYKIGAAGSWVDIVTYDYDTGNGDKVILDLPAIVEGESEVYIRFYYEGTWAWYWYIDDVSIFHY
jgi:Lamin Tail Domain